MDRMLSVPMRLLGSQGLVVSAQGLGCMTAFHEGCNNAQQESKALCTIESAVEHGINFFDTVRVHQTFGGKISDITTNEELLGKAIRIHGRDKFVIAIKFGSVATEADDQSCGNAELMRSQLADSLRRLGVDYIDLYYHHLLDPSTPLEETMECLKSLVKAGETLINHFFEL